MSTAFSRSQPLVQGKTVEAIPPQNPPAEEYGRCVTWQGQVLDMHDWWQELVEIPEVDDYWELAQKI